MPKVLAVRSRDGHYFEVGQISVKTDEGLVKVSLSDAIFAEVIYVDDPPPAAANGHRKAELHRLDGVGGIESEEAIGGLG